MPFKRGDNWYTNVPYHYTDDQGTPRTKRIKRKIGPRKADAVTAEAMIRSRIAAGTYDPNPPQTTEAHTLFSDFVADEFLPWSKMQHSSAHHSQLRRLLEGRIGGAFAGLTLNEVTTKHVTDYMQHRRGQAFRAHGWLSSKRTSAATVNRELAAIKVVLSQAVAWGRIPVSPASGVASLKETPNPPPLLSGAEVARLLAEIPDHLRAAVGLAVYAGLRRAEIMRLRWEHVDLRAGVLTVTKTKSNKNRKVPISADLAKLLRQHPRKLGERLLFPNDNGGVRHDFRTALVAAGKRAGIVKVGMHQLRHAFVSHALMKGADPRSVQLWCGHADLTTTMRYAHTSPDHEKAAIGRVRYEDDAVGREVG